MDPGQPSSGGRKVRFAPKAPHPKGPQPSIPKTGVAGEDDGEAAQAQHLLHRFNENVARQGQRAEKKSSVQVAFGHGASSSTSIRTFGVPRDGNGGKSSGSALKGSTLGNERVLFSSPSTTKAVEGDAYSAGATADATDASDKKIEKEKKEYKEPWDYRQAYYPTTLPLRKPYSGDPELLDKAEFGEAVQNKEFDENTINDASELGLLEECEKDEKERMFFFQLPANLPLVKRPASIKGKEKAESSKLSEDAGASTKCSSLQELSEGYMGKMLVYKSGAIKLKLGETLYDVSPGSDFIFAQDVAAINTADKACCVLGEMGKRAVVTPDVDSLLNAVVNLD